MVSLHTLISYKLHSVIIYVLHDNLKFKLKNLAAAQFELTFGIKGNSYLKATWGRGSFSSLENETYDFDHIINISETERGMPSRLWCFGSFTRLLWLYLPISITVTMVKYF